MLLIKQAPAELLIVHLRQLLEPSVRIQSVLNGPDEDLLKKTKETALTLMEQLEHKVGSSRFLEVYGELQNVHMKKKVEKKRIFAQEAISDPKKFALRKIANTKRKIMAQKRKSLKHMAIRGLNPNKRARKG